MTVSRNNIYCNELAPLASQHHTSEYNRLKFGPQGCPIKYLPLSVQLPEFFQQLQQRQLQCSQADPWCLSDRSCLTQNSPILLGPHGALPHDLEAAHLKEEMQAALTSTLDVKPCLNQLSNPSLKTSSTHPINISAIIPPDLIPLISSQLFFSTSSTPRPSPTVFNISPPFTLNHLTSLSSHRRNSLALYPPPPYISTPQVTINRHARLPLISADRPASIDALPLEKLPNMLHSNSSSISLSLSLTIADTSSPSQLKSGNETSSRSTHSSRRSQGFTTHNQEALPPSQSRLSVGNLFLSSCPGKKVRLEGSVKGRSGVCRDLNMDLKRMKELGVGCVVCCLDDTELEFLGAPWPKYKELAQRNGIDVLRIPTPEGLAPLTPASLDIHLTKVINTYTLHGIPVLVHCRGGVGRAGVVACCWLIRLGLCGWVETSSFSPPAKPSLYKSASSRSASPLVLSLARPHGEMVAAGLRIDTVQFVEKIIAVVRRRRSMKAIETYEQVRFLVDFVEYLREGRVPEPEILV